MDSIGWKSVDLHLENLIPGVLLATELIAFGISCGEDEVKGSAQGNRLITNRIECRRSIWSERTDVDLALCAIELPIVDDQAKHIIAFDISGESGGISSGATQCSLAG